VKQLILFPKNLQINEIADTDFHITYSVAKVTMDN